MITATDDLPNNLRAAALIALTTHGPDCPDRQVHEAAASLMLRVADAEDTGRVLRVGERAAALRTARGYLTAREPAEVPA